MDIEIKVKSQEKAGDLKMVLAFFDEQPRKRFVASVDFSKATFAFTEYAELAKVFDEEQAFSVCRMIASVGKSIGMSRTKTLPLYQHSV